MNSVSLSLRETDQSYVARGDVSLTHAVNICNHKTLTENPTVKINGTTLRTIQQMNIKSIRDIGKWMFNDDGTITVHAHKQVFDKSWTQPARKNWANITKTLHDHLHINDILCGTTELAIPRPIRQDQAENYI